MTYEYMMGMGTAEEAREMFTRGQAAYSAGRYSEAYDAFSSANREQSHPVTLAAMGSAAAALNRCSQAIAHFSAAISAGGTLTADAQRQYDDCRTSSMSAGELAPDIDFATGEEARQPSATAEKESWWSGDITGMVDSFFNKLGIGEQASSEAEGAAREAAGEAPAPAPTSLSQTQAGAQQPPQVQIDETDTTPWYVQYAPHMVIGGLGLGAVIVTLAIVIRKR